MVKPVSALSGAAFQGFVDIAETGLRGMVTLRGNLKSPAMAAAVQGVTGCGMPGVGQINLKRSRGVAWMSPDELLLFGPYASAKNEVATVSGELVSEHHLVTNVSDARAVFRVSGRGSSDVIAKLSPADLRGLQPGTLRRTRFAQVAAAFHMPKADTFEIICFRSMASYMFELLVNAGQSGLGSEPTVETNPV